jgi:hypothetical protein
MREKKVLWDCPLDVLHLDVDGEHVSRLPEVDRFRQLGVDVKGVDDHPVHRRLRVQLRLEVRPDLDSLKEKNCISLMTLT